MATRTWIMRFMEDGYSHERDSHGKDYTMELRKKLLEISDKGPGMIPEERHIALPAVFATIQETVSALVDRRVDYANLEPEIGCLKDIMQWFYYHAREEVSDGTLSWDAFGLRDEIDFEVQLLNWGVYCDLLRVDERSAVKFSERMIGRKNTIRW